MTNRRGVLKLVCERRARSARREAPCSCRCSIVTPVSSLPDRRCMSRQIARSRNVMVLTPVERIPGRSGGLADQVASALFPPADNGPFTTTKLGTGAIANSHPTFTDAFGGHVRGTRPWTWSSTRPLE